jgi:spore maturation protein CgeB
LVGKSGPIKVVVADDSRLVYSDNWRNGWLTGFKQIGCDVVVVDIAKLRELQGGGIYSTRGGNYTKGLVDNIKQQRPDLVWCYHGRAAGITSFAGVLKQAGIRTAVYLPDEPYECGESSKFSSLFDVVFTMDYCTIGIHEQARQPPNRGRTYYLPPCADVTQFCYKDYRNREVPAFFLGNPMLIPREKFLRAVEKVVDGADIRFWPNKGIPITKFSKQWVKQEEHPLYYSTCKVGLNVHRAPGITKECFNTRVLRSKGRHIALPTAPPKEDGTGFWNDFDAPASHVNPRFFEMAACGTLVVSDNHRLELERMFPYAPRANTPEEYVALVAHYLNNLDEAETIGQACCFEIFKRHTFRHRAAEVMIRVGLMDRLPESLLLSLGEQKDWLTPQDLQLPKGKSSSERTGHCGSWNPQSGLSLTRMFGSPNLRDSLDAPIPWSP